MIANTLQTDDQRPLGHARQQIIHRRPAYRFAESQNAAMQVKAGYGVDHRLAGNIDRRIVRRPRQQRRQPLDAIIRDEDRDRTAQARSQELGQHHFTLGDKESVPAHKIALAHLPVSGDARIVRVVDANSHADEAVREIPGDEATGNLRFAGNLAYIAGMSASAPRLVRCAIVGAGPAGYTAAIYAARAMLAPVMIAGIQPGGQLMITTDVENYPGFADVIQGPWLMEQMRAQAEQVGTEIVEDIVTAVDLSVRPFRLTLDSGGVLDAETVIIATGAQAKWLGLPSEQALQGFGVSACATCDGFFYRGKEVLVIGGGNTAIEEALYLTNHATKVTLIHRRDELRAERILQERLFAHPKIQVIWNTAIEEITGDQAPPGVTGARLKNLVTGETDHISADGVFIAIGHAPASELFRGQLEMSESGYLKVTPGTTGTAVPGVFAAGDVTDDVYRQAVTAAGMGCMAALEAVRFLADQDHAKAGQTLSHAQAEKIGVW